jgi:uncharacterized protein DUF669
MPLLQDDMSQVPSPTEAVEEGSYHVRITQAEVTTSKENNMPCVKLLMKVQDEGKMLGRTIPDTASLQSHALFKLKGYYNAVGYKPGPEGHDPSKLVDGECYVNVEHATYQGKPTINIPPWSIRSLQEGPARSKSQARTA